MENLVEIDPGQTDSEGRTALHLAAMKGQAGVVRLLIKEFHANPDQVDSKGLTALHLAAKKGQAGVVRLLIEEFHADINRQSLMNSPGFTALHMAVVEGHQPLARMLIEEFHADVYQPNKHGFTALHMAAAEGHESMARMLIEEFHVDVDQPNLVGVTPLHMAAGESRESMLLMLIKEFKADVNRKDSRGCTALHFAIISGRTEVARTLVNVLQANVDQKDAKGRTALHLSAIKGFLPKMRVLVEELKADVNQVDSDGHTALRLAELQGHKEIVNYLSQYMPERQSVISASLQAEIRKEISSKPRQLVARREELQNDNHEDNNDHKEDDKPKFLEETIIIERHPDLPFYTEGLKSIMKQAADFIVKKLESGNCIEQEMSKIFKNRSRILTHKGELPEVYKIYDTAIKKALEEANQSTPNLEQCLKNLRLESENLQKFIDELSVEEKQFATTWQLVEEILKRLDLLDEEDGDEDEELTPGEVLISLLTSPIEEFVKLSVKIL